MYAADDRPRIAHDWRCNQPVPEVTEITDSDTNVSHPVARCWACGAFTELDPEREGGTAA